MVIVWSVKHPTYIGRDNKALYHDSISWVTRFIPAATYFTCLPLRPSCVSVSGTRTCSTGRKERTYSWLRPVKSNIPIYVSMCSSLPRTRRPCASHACMHACLQVSAFKRRRPIQPLRNKSEHNVVG
jgi:hypothetical protein